MTAVDRTNKPRILVVEDDLTDRAIISSALDKEGYEYALATNGQEAIDLYSQDFFPIIITDWVMPEMDGLELCRLIRSMKIQRYIYIILLTSQDSKSDMVTGLEAGADDYLVKPLHRAELRVRLKSACRILDLESTLKQSMAEIRELSVRDALTGAFNRGYMDHQLQHEIKRTYRYHHPLSIIMCDIDHFKQVNDTFGHQAGDEVLKNCVTRINASIRRGIDWSARYGGEEFVIVLPETDQPGCFVVAERIRQLIAINPIDAFGCEIDITASFGAVTIMPADSRPQLLPDQLIHMADTCLYKAKTNGRNRVESIIASSTGPLPS